MNEKLELFHRLADRASANVRARVVERGVEAEVLFRNVHFESHRARLADVGGTGEVPAIFDGERLHVGEEACLARIDALRRG